MSNSKILIVGFSIALLMVSSTAWSADTPPSVAPASSTNTAEADSAPAVGKPEPSSAEIAAKLQQAQQEVVLARVGDQKITAGQFMQYIKQDTRLVMKSMTDQGRSEVLREMLVDRLLEEGMRREGLLPKDRAPSSKDYLEAYQQLASRYFPKGKEVPPEEELYKYYQQYPESFGVPAMVRVSQIQLRVPANADEKTRSEVRIKAEEVLKRLKAGESFTALAETLTENPQAKVAGGDLGFLQFAKYPWLQKAIADLQVGQISGVLESPAGYEILLLQDKRDAMLAPYANVRENVIGMMRQEAQAKAREQYAWKLAKEVGVTVEQPELKSAIPETLP